LPNQELKKNGNSASKAAYLGYTMIATMIVFTGIGFWLDKEFNTQNQGLTLAGIFLGLLFCAYEVWKLLQEINQKKD
jgi:F0F1-type ATP synthase assembly protein I